MSKIKKPTGDPNKVHGGQVLDKSAGEQFWAPLKETDENGEARVRFEARCRAPVVETVCEDNIWLVRNFLSQRECDELIRVTEEIGYAEAPITTASGPVMRKDIRNNNRLVVQDEGYVAKLYQRMRDHQLLPQSIKIFDAYDWDWCGLNERFRFYRYIEGQQFAPHFDGCFPRSETERSFYTVIVYLSEDFTGGSTTFWDSRLDGGTYSVVPETGMCLIFRHRGWLHAGDMLESGCKYVLRSDAMYRERSSKS